jgi:hypothetical protein
VGLPAGATLELELQLASITTRRVEGRAKVLRDMGTRNGTPEYGKKPAEWLPGILSSAAHVRAAICLKTESSYETPVIW